MNTLEKLALPYLNDKMINEVNYCKSSYVAIDSLKDSKVNKDQSKKKILMVAFESLVGLFDLGYDEKLAFNKKELDSIYIENITDMPFDDAFYNMYEKCFYKYLSKIHTFINNRIDGEMYKIAKLAHLNNDDVVLKKLVRNTYFDIFSNGSSLELKFVNDDISKEDIKRLLNLNKKRIDKLKENVMKYKENAPLSFSAIKNVYMCFSKDIFDGLTKEERVHISKLLFNYYSDQTNLNKKYNKLINENISNKDCLKLVINDLLVPGRTMIIMKKNNDLINDFCSGISYVYFNETDKKNLNYLDDIYKISKLRK